MRVSGLLKQTWAGLRVLIVLIVLCGLVYPLAVWAVSRMPGLHDRTEGSIVTVDGRAVGSSLIGMNPVGDRYFPTRPSARASDASTTDRTKLGLGPIDPSSSTASNLAVDSDVLAAQVTARRALIARREGVSENRVPPDAVTESGSGIDPDISPVYAHLQAARVAWANGLPDAQVRRIGAENVHGRAAGVLGDPTVSVLALDLAAQTAVAARSR